MSVLLPKWLGVSHDRHFAPYACLLLLFAVAVTHQVRDGAEELGMLLHSTEHVRDPFELNGYNLTVGQLQPEATSVGIAPDDRLIEINGRAPQGYTDLYSLLRHAHPGERLNLRVASSKLGGGAPRNVSVELQSAFPPGPLTSEWLAFCVESVAIPVVCLSLGFWVAVVRVRDKLAWLLLVLLLSFAEMFWSPLAGYRILYGREGWFEPAFTAYHMFFANVFTSALLLFALYFPEQLRVERRFPWVKWLVLGPLLLHVIADAIVVSLYLHHVAAAREFWSVVGTAVDETVDLHVVAVLLFFVILGLKTIKATDRDARRRLLLLDIASFVSVAPMMVWLFYLRSRYASPQWSMLLLAALWFLFPLTIAYVILVYRAMEVRLVIRQGLRYLLAKTSIRAGQVIVSLAIILIAAGESASGGDNVARRVGLIAAGFALIALLGTFAGRLQSWLDRRFFREAYNSEQILSDLADQVRRIVDRGSIVRTVAHRISESLHVPRVALLLSNGGSLTVEYAIGYAGGAMPELPQDSLTVQHLRTGQQLTIHPAVQDSWLERAGEVERESIASLEPELLLPLALNEKLIGIMSLGPKQSEEPFTRTDLRLLDSVATQTGLALENGRLTAEIASEVAERERVNRELEIAREVQQRLFPQKAPTIPGIEIAGFCRPAFRVGGDYYDYFALADGSLGIAIGDVSGKGFPAALLMASLRASLRAQTMRGDCDLAAIMQNVNTLGYESSAANKYATFFYAQFSPESRVLSYVNAGHEPPLIFRQDSVIQLECGGPVVGLLPLVQYQQGTLKLEPGDLFVALTDGISEAMNCEDEEWGVENFISCVSRSERMPCGDLIECLIKSADAFVSGAKQHDDMTLVVARIW